MTNRQPLLGESELAGLRASGTTRSFSIGSRLISTGDASTHVFYLLSGLVKIVVLAPSGNESVFGFRYPGSFVGEMSALNAGRRNADVIAVEPTRALAIRADRFLEYLRSRPNVSFALLQMQSRRLEELTVRSALGGCSVKARIAQQLLKMADVPTHSTSQEFTELRLTQVDLAKWIDASREWTSRAIGELRHRGAIQTSRGRILITDRGELERAALDP